MNVSPKDAASAGQTRANRPDASERLDLAPERAFPESTRGKGLWKKLKRGLLMTHTELLERLDAAVEGRGMIDEETLDFLEESLIGADLGVETASELVAGVRTMVRPGQASDLAALRDLLADQVAVLLLDAPQPPALGNEPLITLVVGVNGVGKTTSIAKLGRLYRDRGEKVVLAAADTFRAAAIDQIALWAERLDIDVIKQQPGGDPAAVVFDAIQAARARQARHVIVDTAGRLHNQEHLMAELAKIGRVIRREAAGWQQRTLLVLDATTGQNAITQARQFIKTVPVDGVFLTKLDGTAKGGVAVAVARDLRLPVVFLGVGEQPTDIVAFNARDFATALFR